MRRLSTIAFAVALAAQGIGAASAATPEPAGSIGTTLAVVNVVTAELATERRTLAIGDRVRQNELIEAALDARTELKLEDETKLALGPGSRLVLDRFVYDPEKKNGDIAVDLIKGAFRFVTGIASKPSYVVRVPRASITVRGTIFDVFVQKTGAAWLLLHEGGVKVCNDRGTCRMLSEPGKLVLINEVGDIGKTFRWASLGGLQGFDFDAAFPFVADPPSIDPKPNLTREAILDIKTPKSSGKADKKAEVTDPEPPAAPAPAKISNGTKTPLSPAPTEAVVKLPKPKKPKLDSSAIESKGRKWKQIAEKAASRWMKRTRDSESTDNWTQPVLSSGSVPVSKKHTKPGAGESIPKLE